jgi:hypothetical protein
MTDVEEFRKALKASLAHNQEILLKEGNNQTYYQETLSLSKDDIDAIVPNGTSSGVYADLISVLKEAARHNVQQAELVSQIKQLGQSAISIAKLVPPLAALL